MRGFYNTTESSQAEKRRHTPTVLDQVAPVQTSAKPGKPIRGTCRKCGCQELTPCAGGCGWADKSETRCTACFPPTLKSRAKKAKRA